MGLISRELIVTIATGVSLALLTGVAFLIHRFRQSLIRFFVLRWGGHFPQRKDAEQNKAVYTALVELRALTNADRAYVLRFHNGAEFLLSNPVWKVSCTHEVVKPGVTYESQNIQGILMSRIPKLIDPILTGESPDPGIDQAKGCGDCPAQPKCQKDRKFTCVVCVDEMQDSWAKFFLHGQNIQTVVQSGMVTRGGAFGIVGVDFCGQPLSDEAYRQVCEYVCRTATHVQFLLQYKPSTLSVCLKG